MDYIEISYFQLLGALAFILLSAALSVLYKLGLEKDLLIGSLRATLQLTALGYILNILFHMDIFLAVMAVYIFMIFFATSIVKKQVGKQVINFFGSTFFSNLIAYSFVSIFVTAFIVGATPWWKAQYFLPLAGMVIGNSMTALSLCLERYFTDVKNKKSLIEMMLSMGATVPEASHPLFKKALKAGMVPSINSLMGVGVVFIPGMMSGQVLSGIDPIEAVKYQIVVMFMIVASTAISCFLALKLVEVKLFKSYK